MDYISFDEYRDLPGINATSIKAGVESMRAMHHTMTAPEQPPTPQMHTGKLLHAAVLEPADFFGRCAVWSGPVKRGKAWDEFQCENEDAYIVTNAELEQLNAASLAVHTNPHARDLITATDHEVTLQWSGDKYGEAKARLDGFDPEVGIVEYKTTNQIEPEAFFRSAYRMNYHIQLGWYSIGVRAEMDGYVPVWVIVQSQSEPYDCFVASVNDLVLDPGRAEAERIAAEYHKCCQNRDWPGVAADVVEYKLPPYAYTSGAVDLMIGGETLSM